LEGVMISIGAVDASQVSEVRRAAEHAAAQNGFVANDVGRVALVATELATNLVKHGGGGEALIGTYDDGGGRGIEVIALDRGPGMTNVEACLRDGYSTAGTPGNGLGAVSRQANVFDIASWPGVGTAVLARIESAGPRVERPVVRSGWGAVSIAMPGETICGDAWAVSGNGDVRTLFVADGLGHGHDAAEAAVEAVRLFHRFNGHQIPALLDYVHGGLRATRGAAVSIARFDPAAGRMAFGGIGNVAGTIVAGGDLKRLISMPGTAGHVARKIQSFDYPFETGLIVLNSDGLVTGWNLDRYRGLQAVHPTLIAAILYRDFSRRRDDATVLVGKWVA
jgi:anti-sigma regulatory factor (Ser/Thr protein kinase)